MRDELGPQRFFDIERSYRIPILVNRAVRLNNRAGIDKATIDDKGAVYCNDAQVEAELQQEYDRLEAEMRQVGMGLQETLGQIVDGNIVYDPTHEDPFGTSDLKQDPMPPDHEHLPGGWGESDWYE